ncbi:MAG: zinc-binding dehydrogenase [Verrucomicrobiae bacterium]|nr:zinc-binding dehydrogenase [Verrucomicrobiae bacterium]
MKLKAAILTECRQPLEVADISCPETPSYGQVLVKVFYSGICGTQINEIEGSKGEDHYLPHLLGHEGSGEVLAIGEGVRNVKVGDHVVLHWRPGAGIQATPASYDWNGRKVNAGWVTTFNNFALVSENRVTAIPRDFDPKQAPLFGCAVTTAFGVVNNDAQLKIGQSIVIFGVGGVGLNIAQAASLSSGHPIVGIDIHDSKVEMAMKFGASHGLNSAKCGDLRERILNIVGPSGADVVVDTTGNPRVIETAYDLTHPDGRTILVGVPKKGDNISIYSLPLHFKKILKGSHGGSSEPHIEIPRFVRLMGARKLQLEGLFTHEYPLERINEAISTMKNGVAARILIRMEH